MAKYYANIKLYFDDMKYSMVDSDTTRKEMVEAVKKFAESRKLTCNTKTKKIFNKEGKEVGEFEITSASV